MACFRRGSSFSLRVFRHLRNELKRSLIGDCVLGLFVRVIVSF